MSSIVHAYINGRWLDCLVKRRCDDGTLIVEPSRPSSLVLSEWVGITQAEVCDDPEAAWAPIFVRYARHGMMDLSAFHRLARDRGIDITIEGLRPHLCKVAPKHGVDPEVLQFTQDQALDSFKDMGGSPLIDPPDSPWYRYYWNQIRIGGRDPSETGDKTIEDALSALFLVPGDDLTAMEAWEAANPVTLPKVVRLLLSSPGVHRAFRDSHSTWPALVPVEELTPQTEGADTVMQLVTHRGDSSWWIRWRPGQDDPSVECRASGEANKPVAPTLSYFLWDVASTGK
ncbi:MAG: hypothetical protein AAFV53_22730 [Myxococcota bacterium]